MIERCIFAGPSFLLFFLPLFSEGFYIYTFFLFVSRRCIAIAGNMDSYTSYFCFCLSTVPSSFLFSLLPLFMR